MPPVHPAAAVRHRWRLARLTAPGSGSAFRCPVHRQSHGVVPPISNESLPRGFDHADDSLATRMHVDVLHRDFLLALAAMAIERFEEGGVRSGLKRPIYFMAACLASQSRKV